MSALDRKLLRDLWASRGQAIAIALVVAAGIALFVAMMSTFDSLDLSLRTYYDRYRFADVFVSLTRAPLSLEADDPRDPRRRAGRDARRRGRDARRARHGRAGHRPADLDPRRPAAGALRRVPARRPDDRAGPPRRGAGQRGVRQRRTASGPATRVGAIINGRRRELRIVGLALSPEYIYPIRPGELMPDEARFGVFWMERRALGAAFQMEGAFNDVVVKLMHGASEADVIARLDRLLDARYGGRGRDPARAAGVELVPRQRARRSCGRPALIIPVIFLGVAAFLLNVVLNRVVAVQRTQIAAIKALGYRERARSPSHYVKWSLVGGGGRVDRSAWGSGRGSAGRSPGCTRCSSTSRSCSTA